MPHRRALSLFACAALGAGYACSQFEADNGPAGSVDDGGAGADANAMDDGGAPPPSSDDDGGTGVGTCPGSASTLDPAGVVERVQLTVESGKEASIFGLAADDQTIFWLEQVRDKGKTAPDIYNGHGSSRIRRRGIVAPGTDAGPVKMPVTVLADLGRALELVLVGNRVFFVKEVGGISELHRFERDCKAPCTSTTIWSGSLPHVRRLKLSTPTTLAAVLDDGRVISFDGIMNDNAVPLERGAVGANPSLGAASGRVWAGSLERDAVMTFDPNASSTPVEFARIPASSASAPGAGHLAAACDVLYGVGADSRIWRSPISSTGAFEAWGEAGDPAPSTNFGQVYDTAADNEYLYIASANVGGVRAIDRKTGVKHFLYGGNVWHLTVTDRLLAWGEHDQASLNGGGVFVLWKK